MTPDERRYSRQILFPPIGPEGQQRLRAATVGLVGLGALGSCIAEMLVRAGIRRLVAVDRDILELSNLHRQGLYLEEDAESRLPKAEAARRRLAAVNSDVEVTACAEDLSWANAQRLLGDCDVLMDGTDNFETRYLLNDLALELDRPWVYGACVAATGMTATIVPGVTPCLRCLFPEPPPPGSAETCDTAGIIAPAAAVIASIQVAECLKLLVGDVASVRRSLLSIELWPFRTVEIGREATPRENCPACGAGERAFLRGGDRSRTTVLCGRDTVQITPSGRAPVDFDALEERLEPHAATIRRTELALFATIDGRELTVFQDGRALIKGADDEADARSTYARWIGS